MYDEEYYKRHQAGSYQSALQILRFVHSITHFQTIIDYGCGIGTWGNASHSLGTKEYLGIDQHAFDAGYMLISKSEYLQEDLRHPIRLHSFYDLAICVEVAEHISEEFADMLIDNICRNSEVVLFSAALVYQGGTGHVNEQPCTYWIEKFRSKGYTPVDCIRPAFWDDEQIEIWYRNNCILYMTHEAFNRYHQNIPIVSLPANIIHPQMLERILYKRGLK